MFRLYTSSDNDNDIEIIDHPDTKTKTFEIVNTSDDPAKVTLDESPPIMYTVDMVDTVDMVKVDNFNESEKNENVELDSDSDSNLDSEYEFCLTDKSEKFVVTVNDVPEFYTKDIESARSLMWDVARTKKLEYYSFNTLICESNNDVDEIHILGYNRFLLVSYVRTLCKFKIHTVKEMKYKSD